MELINKKFFRYLRGEINGFYLNKLAYFVNDWVDKSIMPALYYMKTVQFDVDSMTPEDILNLAKFAGIVQAITLGRMTENTIRMPVSETSEGNTYENYSNAIVISNPLEVSERGLYDTVNEEFNFDYWNDQHHEDIAENATPQLQTSLVPSDRTKWPVLGYIAEGTVIYDSEGNLLPRSEWLLDKPPVNKAYTEFYGEQFLHFEEDFIVKTAVPFEVIYQIFVAIQEVRYSGSSIKSLAKLTEIVVGDVVKIGNHVYNADSPLYIVWYYKVDKSNIKKPYVDVRINVWLNLVESFFPQIRMEEA